MSLGRAIISFNDYYDPKGVSKRRLGCALVRTMCSPQRVLVKRWSCDRETAIQDHTFFPTKGWIISWLIMIKNGVFAPGPGAQSWGGPHRRPKIAFFRKTGKAKSQFWDGGWDRKNEFSSGSGFNDKEETRRPTRAPGSVSVIEGSPPGWIR